MTNLCCPSCKGVKIGKYGRNAARRQKYKCLDPGCRRQFVAGSDHLIDRDIKSIAERLLFEKISPAKVANVMKGRISRSWIYEIAKMLKRKAQEHDG